MDKIDLEKLATIANKVLSDFTINSKYAKYIASKQRRETWEEMCIRNMNMHLDKYPHMTTEILNTYHNFVFNKKVLPSMRSLQFAGKPIELNNSRIFNCAYLPVDDLRSFSETMFLLLGGTGVGFSVQKRHIKKLPKIIQPTQSQKYVIQDSIIGWADAVKVLMKAYMEGGIRPEFCYDDIRLKGSPLKTTGGKAPGYEGLKRSLDNIEKILQSKKHGTKLKPIDVHDIQCFLAEAVLSGGIRRSATISFFDFNDEEMLTCKSGEWWIDNPQRAMANNSVVAVRHKIKKADFYSLWDRIKSNRTGEPGIVFTNNPDVLGNPCYESGLKAYQFCNLIEINSSNIESQEDFNDRVKAATVLATLQAGYTDFHYLRPIWKETTEEDNVLGVSMTGISSGKVLSLDLRSSAELTIIVNQEISSKIGINPSTRITNIKPGGTTSLVLGSASGVHAYHSPWYIRRIRMNKEEAVYKYLIKVNPEIIVDCLLNPDTTAILEIPVKAPEGSIFRNESSLDLLERVKKLHEEWIKPGHVSGDNTHNVSTTVSVKEDEWDTVRDWMWENRDSYNGISILPSDTGSYFQTPFEEITEEEYIRRVQLVKDIDFSKIIETEDVTDLTGEAACAGGACIVT